jgi:hypothetical protein
LFAIGGGQGEGGGRGVLFKCHVFQCQVSDFVLPR